MQYGRPEFDPWVGKIPLEEGMASPSSILAWRIPTDRGAWWVEVHAVSKSQKQLSLHRIYEHQVEMRARELSNDLLT